MKRSSPVNVTPMSMGAPPTLATRAARYSPTGQPSVLRTSSRRFSSESSTPASASRAAASSSFIASSSAPISTMPPWARRRADGSGNSFREPMASCDPSGRPRASAAIGVEALAVGHRFGVVEHEGDRAVHRGHRRHQSATPLTAAPAAESARNTAGSIGSMRCSATAM